MGRPLALDGRCLMGGHNNQPKVGVNGGGGIGEETQLGRNVWGGVVSSFRAVIWTTKKSKITGVEPRP